MTSNELLKFIKKIKIMHFLIWTILYGSCMIPKNFYEINALQPRNIHFLYGHVG